MKNNLARIIQCLAVLDIIFHGLILYIIIVERKQLSS